MSKKDEYLNCIYFHLWMKIELGPLGFAKHKWGLQMCLHLLGS